MEDEGASRYRTGWDENAKADSPDSAADTPDNAASTPLTVQGKDANWDSCAASRTVDISN